MKNSFLFSALCLLLTACTVTSDNPLSSPDKSLADLRLLGTWLQKKDHDIFRFTLKKGAWTHVDIIPTTPDGKVDSYDFYPTVIGKDTFLNVVLVGKNAQGHPRKTFTFARYTISGSTLQIWMISQDALADAVRAGKLKGTVHQDKDALTVGNPPHPDVDVQLSDTSENIVKFIQASNVDELFSDKMEPLERIK